MKKKVYFVVFIVLFFFCISALVSGTMAEIITKTDGFWKLNKGIKDGVTAGMKGYFWTRLRSTGEKWKVALYRVIEIEERYCYVKVEKRVPGFTEKNYSWAEFLQTLKPPKDYKPEKTKEKIVEKAAKEKKEPKQKPEIKTVEWFYNKANEFYNQKDYEQAKKNYQIVLEMINPMKTKAELRIKECNEKIQSSEKKDEFSIYLDKGDKALDSGEINKALDYYLKAYNKFPSKEKIIAEKFVDISKKYKKEWETFKEKNKASLKNIIDKYFVPEFLKFAREKAKNLYKNDKGFWEAEFDYSIKMIYIPEGKFKMGSEKGDPDEKPVHEVSLDGFWIGKYEVLQSQWNEVIGSNPSYFKNLGKNAPVENISWKDIQEFLNKLKTNTGIDFRLPSEAEWEKACDYNSLGKKDKKLDDVAIYKDNNEELKYPVVGTKQPNKYGIYDMLGLLWEWCNDYYGENYYSASPDKNPMGPVQGSKRVVRGGSWKAEANSVRVTNRFYLSPDTSENDLGFRLCLKLGNQ